MDRLNERAELMGRMLDTIGAMKNMPAGIHSDAAIRSAAIRCINCGNTEACKRWLQEHPDGAASPMKGCPNEELFKSWLED
ncbi:DUF6455 family protein [uncultured Roseibium sp.]|uniref:DUF6455 family protein n=1 Tax=uncultured Roseibium sp. TaxID=1936171 RepID=UPI002616B439|nr:DUF6455 family protein [uncultured Roseibium sp.]